MIARKISDYLKRGPSLQFYLVLAALGLVAFIIDHYFGHGHSGGLMTAGAAITTTNPADFANREQKLFDRKLNKALAFNLRLGSYGTAKPLTQKMGADTIRFFRKRRATRKFIGNLTEGVKPTNLTEVTTGYVDCKVLQRGGLATMTDLVLVIDIFDTKSTYSTSMGEDAALDFDSVCSHAICSQPGLADQDGTPNPIPAGTTYTNGGTMYGSNTNFERFAGIPFSGNSANDFASLAAASANAGRMTRAIHLGAMTRMKGVNGNPGVPSIAGRYPVLCPPEVIGDMRQDTVWTNAAVFNNIKDIGLFPWAEFQLDGGVFIEHNAPFIENCGGTYGQYDNSNAAGPIQNIYSVIYLGQDAFCVPKMGGSVSGSDPMSPSMIILDKADKADPLNQIMTLGWKSHYQAILFLTNEASDQPHLVVQRVRSTFQ